MFSDQPTFMYYVAPIIHFVWGEKIFFKYFDFKKIPPYKLFVYISSGFEACFGPSTQGAGTQGAGTQGAGTKTHLKSRFCSQAILIKRGVMYAFDKKKRDVRV